MLPAGSSVDHAAPAEIGHWFLAVPAEIDSRIGRSGNDFPIQVEMDSRIGRHGHVFAFQVDIVARIGHLAQDLASRAEIDSMIGIAGWFQMIPASRLQMILDG